MQDAKPYDPDELRGPRPHLQLDEDVYRADRAARVQELLDRLARDGRHIVALDEQGSAVAIPIDRYIDLIGTELESRHDGFRIEGDGRVVPQRLEDTGLIHEDPNSSWAARVFGIGPQSRLRAPDDGH